jgi:ABC-type multidrug transport system fused ATPase/permease subunit
MGMFGNLNAEAYDRSYSDRVLLGRIFSYFRGYRSRVVVISIMTLAMAGAGAAIPLLVSNGVQSLVQNQSDAYFVGLVAVVLLVGVLNWAANWVRRRFAAVVTATWCWRSGAMRSTPRSATTCPLR